MVIDKYGYIGDETAEDLLKEYKDLGVSDFRHLAFQMANTIGSRLTMHATERAFRRMYEDSK
jgi:hypothetical protein